MEHDIIDRNYFCAKRVLIEVAHKKGLLKGFLDFTNDDYRDVVVNNFDDSRLFLNFKKEIDIDMITKIEELCEE